MEDWHGIARSLGYDSEKEMFYDLYIVEEMSLAQIGRRLGFGNTILRRRITACGINLRGQGGPNNLSRLNRKLHYADQRLIFKTPLPQVAKMFKVHAPSVWKYRKLVTGGYCGVLRDQPSVGSGPVFKPE